MKSNSKREFNFRCRRLSPCPDFHGPSYPSAQESIFKLAQGKRGGGKTTQNLFKCTVPLKLGEVPAVLSSALSL